MKYLLSGLLFLGASTAAQADVTLKCETNQRCDSYLNNCVNDPYSFSVNVDPKREVVTIGSKQIKADFSNPAEVTFVFTNFTYYINRYEYSAVLTTEKEVRHGFCSKIEPAW